MKKLYKAPALKSIEFEVSDKVLLGTSQDPADHNVMETKEFVDWDED